MKSKKGFTLVELLAVMIIISALSIIIIPSIINYINQNKKDISDAAKNIIYAGAKLYLDNNASLYPKNEGYSNCIKLKDITDAGYLESPLLDIQSGRNIDLDNNYVKASYVYDYDLQVLTYKYSVSDSCETTIADGYEWVEGDSVQLTDKAVVDYKIYGNSVQNGTPTPSNPIEIESVGEKTYNLLTINDRSLIIKEGGTSDKGITFTPHEDHSFSVNGTYTGTTKTMFALSSNNGFTENTECRLMGCVGGSTNTYYFQSYNGYKDIGSGVNVSAVNDINRIYFVVEPGAVFDNVRLYPQLVLGGENKAYEPYGKYKIPVTVSGKNLFHKQGSITTERMGLTVTYDSDTQEYTINGTTNAQGNLILSDGDFQLKAGETFKFKVHKVSGEATVGSGSGITYAYALFSQDVSKYTRGSTMEATFGDYTFNGTMFENSGGVNNKVLLQLWRVGTTFNNFKIKIQIERGDDWTDFEPYVEPITTNIYLDEPLRKIGDYSDYIDFKNQKIHRVIKEQVLNGNENYSSSASSSAYNGNISTNRYLRFPENTIVSTTGSQNVSYCTDLGWYRLVWGVDGASGHVTNNTMQFHMRYLNTTLGIDATDDYQTRTTKFAQYIESRYNSGNPVKIYYPLATPIEESIVLPDIPLLTGTITYAIGTETQPSKLELLVRDK